MEVQIVLRNSVVFHINLRVRKRLKYLFYTKIHGLRICSFSLITYIPLCVIISHNFIQFKKEFQFPPWLPFFSSLHYPAILTSALPSLLRKSFPASRRFLSHWIIESFLSRLTFLLFIQLYIFSHYLPHHFPLWVGLMVWILTEPSQHCLKKEFVRLAFIVDGMVLIFFRTYYLLGNVLTF